MKVLVIIAHPAIEQSTVNKAWMEELKKHDNITVHELYQEYKEEIDVKREQELCEAHDRIVWQFPFYWYSSPSLLKEWQDKVLTYGWAYGANGNALHGKELILAVTTGSGEEKYRAGGLNHYSMSELLKPFQATSNLIGTTFLPSYLFYGTSEATKEEIQKSAKEYAEYILTPLS
ncbi:NAD(P)H-dependent oxidoreductase [Priestia filamentosa]|uniref:General stress protein n=1 Tax=Priestia filamentosa TaxID=1402861 RepID=A0A1X7F3C6_9BACI|nr:NAD(P)H-dependent oxidoreductase [Priestia filamentosa]AKO91653.1 general stress protein [Priestia filamentosa]MDT3761769.1 NAD(P)H-dependent oxidoreductase [Priestia filamentosa]OXS67862.1 general stress protein [Priestia filamentosa]RJS64938.1 flavodoxin family protein [Priestia filamentosa]WCM16864.1 NAD(P)H-dependent oxidoreductase [Priestia filamentosa]